MHRKFIALIVATAIAITGVSASQARAADTKDILGGLAAIAIIGAAVHHYNKDKDKDRVQPVNITKCITRNPRSNTGMSAPCRNAWRATICRSKCLRTFKGYSPKRQLLGPKCLKKHYKHANSLPQQCKVGFWNGKKVKRGYEPACLRQKGYRVVYQ